MTLPVNRTDNTLWTQRAMAFVTRSHRHLWGKNNEDPLAFLFTCGLNHACIKTYLLGWNKFGQHRPARNWGDRCLDHEKKLFLPPGIVIPVIVEKQLKGIFIHSYQAADPGSSLVVPGSPDATLVLEAATAKVVVVQNPLHGLLVFQEMTRPVCVVIHPDLNLAMAPHASARIQKAFQRVIYTADAQNHDRACRFFAHIPKAAVVSYSSTDELLALCSDV